VSALVAVACDMPFLTAELLSRAAPVRATLDPVTIDVDEHVVASVNTPQELAAAQDA
jgi:molybdopterin-guanine dinucleotide biosynthesis protein A